MDILDIATLPMITWNKENQNFSVELSDLPAEARTMVSNRCWEHKPIIVTNSKETNKQITLSFVKADMDGSNEDCYGWNYKGVSTDSKNVRRHFTFLFVND